jgi:hypothetical protein
VEHKRQNNHDRQLAVDSYRWDHLRTNSRFGIACRQSRRICGLIKIHTRRSSHGLRSQGRKCRGDHPHTCTQTDKEGWRFPRISDLLNEAEANGEIMDSTGEATTLSALYCGSRIVFFAAPRRPTMVCPLEWFNLTKGSCPGKPFNRLMQSIRSFGVALQHTAKRSAGSMTQV